MSFTNIAVRFTGVVMFAIPAGLLAFKLTQDGSSQHDELFTPVFYVSFLSLAFFGIPGIYVATKGPLYGDVARTNRRKGIASLIVGLAMLAFGAIVNVLINLVGSLTGLFAFLWYGILGVGAVVVAVGLASLLSGRDLLAEMGDDARSKNE